MKLSRCIVVLAMCLAVEPALAQFGRHHGGPGTPPGRGAERPQREEWRERPGRMEPGQAPERREQNGLSPDERRELRRQIRDHGRDLYRERP